MTDPVALAPGWHPDPDTRGTRYWDGRRWTGDVRPPRRAFAAQASHKGWGIGLTAFGVIGAPTAFSSSNPLAIIVVCLILIAGGVYLFRGQGPTTKSVETRVQAQRAVERAEEEERRAALGAPSGSGQIVINVQADPGTAEAAQIKALADPQTAAALQNLQKLLYTRAITDDEFQAAKNKLLGDLSS